MNLELVQELALRVSFGKYEFVGRIVDGVVKWDDGTQTSVDALLGQMENAANTLRNCVWKSRGDAGKFYRKEPISLHKEG